MEREKFDQRKYQEEKKNMKRVSALFKNDFVADFKEACSTLGIKQADVIREAMQKAKDKEQ